MWQFLAGSLFLLCLVAVVGACPSYWTAFQDSCYAFIHNPSTWSGAAEICRGFDARLADVDSAEENNFLKDFAKMGNSSTNDVWLGGNDLLKENVWVWENGEEVVFTDWSPGEPNNGNKGENCLELVVGSPHQWNDLPCSRTNWFICEQMAPTNSVIG